MRNRSSGLRGQGSIWKLILLWLGAAFLIYVVVLLLWFIIIMVFLW